MNITVYLPEKNNIAKFKAELIYMNISRLNLCGKDKRLLMERAIEFYKNMNT